MDLLKFIIFLTLISISRADELFNSHLLPRPLIIELPETLTLVSDDEIKLQCTSWRFAVEANNVSPWKTIPAECVDYVKEYLTGRGYVMDLERVSKEALLFARSVEVNDDGKDVWIFDIDETLLSNLPYYTEHGYGLEVFDNVQFDKWVEMGKAAALEASLRLYEEVSKSGFKVFLMTGRGERMRSVTVENLKDAGFQKWDRLILRGSDDHGKSATTYKSEKRSQITEEGYRIIGNSGDQWSDLLGIPMSVRSFKLPNPMYFIS
ncbi:hypothetical protein QQ045_006528 [Rhodiola kirilowii]